MKPHPALLAASFLLNIILGLRYSAEINEDVIASPVVLQHTGVSVTPSTVDDKAIRKTEHRPHEPRKSKSPLTSDFVWVPKVFGLTLITHVIPFVGNSALNGISPELAGLLELDAKGVRDVNAVLYAGIEAMIEQEKRKIQVRTESGVTRIVSEERYDDRLAILKERLTEILKRNSPAKDIHDLVIEHMMEPQEFSDAWVWNRDQTVTMGEGGVIVIQTTDAEGHQKTLHALSIVPQQEFMEARWGYLYDQIRKQFPEK